MKYTKILMFLFNPRWDMVLVTSCGVDRPLEDIVIESTADGFSVRVR